MPKMSMTMTEGELVEYNVSVGQVINSGDVVAVVGTDKTNMEVEAEVSGTVLELCAKPGDVLDVGKPMLILETEGEDLLADLFSSSPSPEPVVEDTKPEVASQDAPAQGQNGQILAMPGARKLAKESGLDLSLVQAKSPSGVIKVSDLARSGIPNRAAKAREQMAKVATESLLIPQFTISKELKISKSLPIDSAERSRLISRAWSKTLESNQALNSQFHSGEISQVADIRLALLTQTATGFVAPVLKIDTDGKWELEIEALLHSAQINKIPLENLNGATSAIFDFGELEILQANVLLLPGQSTALVLGSSRLAENGYLIFATLVVDHRIADPGEAAIALRSLEQLLNGELDGIS
jgi:pyruvate dehydrogenase E2 component (dihydrolipoamide acetyltransferase)